MLGQKSRDQLELFVTGSLEQLEHFPITLDHIQRPRSSFRIRLG